MTSSDVLDTCLSVQLTQAADLLLADLDAVLAALKTRAFEHKYTLTIGRSHGIHAEPTTFGLKLAGHYAEFARNRARLVAARAEIAVARDQRRGRHLRASRSARWRNMSPNGSACAPEPVSTQVIPRDRHAAFFCTLGVIASGIERLATEVRHLQRTEVREAEEFFHPGQKGSSAMPHKRNPVLSENLTGLARMVRVRGGAGAGERDAVARARHQPFLVERAIGPDATVDAGFRAGAAGRDDASSCWSIRSGCRPTWRAWAAWCIRARCCWRWPGPASLREDAYRIVQRNAMATWKKLGTPEGRSFRANLQADPDVAGRVSPAELDAAMDPALHLQAVDRIFERVFGEDVDDTVALGD